MNSPQSRNEPLNYPSLFAEMSLEPDFYPWSSEPETGELVWALARLLGSKRVLELGTFRGFMTLQLIRATESAFGEVVTIDCDDHRSPVLRRFDERYQFVQGDDLIVLPQLKQTFDLVYIDTTHTYEHTTSEMELLRRHQPQATLLLHDPLAFPGVAQAIARFNPHYNALTLPTPRRETFGTISGLAILTPKP